MSTLGGLSEAEARIAELEAALGVVEQERDQAQRLAETLLDGIQLRATEAMLIDARTRLAAAEARLAALASLETAARAWAAPDHALHPCDPGDCDVCAALGAAISATTKEEP